MIAQVSSRTFRSDSKHGVDHARSHAIGIVGHGESRLRGIRGLRRGRGPPARTLLPARHPSHFVTIGRIVFPEGRHDTLWQPLLEGAEAERVWAAIHEVAEALRLEAERVGPGSAPSLDDGFAGAGILFAYLAVATGDEAWSEPGNRV